MSFKLSLDKGRLVYKLKLPIDLEFELIKLKTVCTKVDWSIYKLKNWTRRSICIVKWNHFQENI